jgi:uncharacterized membrane protein
MKNQAVSQPNKGMAVLGVALTWLGFIIVMLTKKEDHYAMHYAKQGLVLGIGFVILSFAGSFLFFVPLLGWLLSGALWLGMFILWIIGIIYALSGEEKNIPIVGDLAKKINL